MADRPILFSAPMVRALLDGRKTQTRRVVKPAPVSVGYRPLVSFNHGTPEWSFGPSDRKADGLRWWRCPYGAPGDTLWVRERCWIYGQWRRDGDTRTGRPRWRFEAIGQQVRFEKPDSLEEVAYLGRGPGWSHRNSIHMPRWASRIGLRVTDVRVERLQDISEADAIAEGVTVIAPPDRDGGRHFGVPGVEGIDDKTAKRAYLALWTHINGIASTQANSWTWAVSFERVTP